MNGNAFRLPPDILPAKVAEAQVPLRKFCFCLDKTGLNNELATVFYYIIIPAAVWKGHFTKQV